MGSIEAGYALLRAAADELLKADPSVTHHHLYCYGHTQTTQSIQCSVGTTNQPLDATVQLTVLLQPYGVPPAGEKELAQRSINARQKGVSTALATSVTQGHVHFTPTAAGTQHGSVPQSVWLQTVSKGTLPSSDAATHKGYAASRAVFCSPCDYLILDAALLEAGTATGSGVSPPAQSAQALVHSGLPTPHACSGRSTAAGYMDSAYAWGDIARHSIAIVAPGHAHQSQEQQQPADRRLQKQASDAQTAASPDGADQALQGAASVRDAIDLVLNDCVPCPVNGGGMDGEQRLAVLLPQWPYRLGDLLRFSPTLTRCDGPLKHLLLYQVLTSLVEAVDSMDGPSVAEAAAAITHPDHVYLTAMYCVQMPPAPLTKALLPAPPSCLAMMTAAWQTGHVSNYDYLLYLNRLAGRRWGDPAFHPLLPWTLDLSQPLHSALPGAGWRDLRQTKYRLCKGDAQLDLTYAMAEEPHHVTDHQLSEVTYCIYMARRLPVSLLTRIVRSVFSPREYPVSLTRLYATTPDEAIPEFYSDPSVFQSIHPDMADMALPDWAANAEDFVRQHRMALESQYVSAELHHWIDVTFGYKTAGPAAVAAKNVPLRPKDPLQPRSCGAFCLFSGPHPSRSPAASASPAAPFAPVHSTHISSVPVPDVQHRQQQQLHTAHKQQQEQRTSLLPDSADFSEQPSLLLATYSRTTSSGTDRQLAAGSAALPDEKVLRRGATANRGIIPDMDAWVRLLNSDLLAISPKQAVVRSAALLPAAWQLRQYPCTFPRPYARGLQQLDIMSDGELDSESGSISAPLPQGATTATHLCDYISQDPLSTLLPTPLSAHSNPAAATGVQQHGSSPGAVGNSYVGPGNSSTAGCSTAGAQASGEGSVRIGTEGQLLKLLEEPTGSFVKLLVRLYTGRMGLAWEDSTWLQLFHSTVPEALQLAVLDLAAGLPLAVAVKEVLQTQLFRPSVRQAAAWLRHIHTFDAAAAKVCYVPPAAQFVPGSASWHLRSLSAAAATCSASHACHVWDDSEAAELLQQPLLQLLRGVVCHIQPLTGSVSSANSSQENMCHRSSAADGRATSAVAASEAAASAGAGQDAVSTGAAADFVRLLELLLKSMSPLQVWHVVMSNVVPWLCGNKGCSRTLIAAMLRPTLMQRLEAVVGLQRYLAHVHPLVMSALRTDCLTPSAPTAAAVTRLLQDAARSVCLSCAYRWSVPLSLRHLLRPLALLLGEHPRFALLLADVAAVLPSEVVLQHVAPMLVRLVADPSHVQVAESGKNVRQVAKDAQGLASLLHTAQDNALTALSGLMMTLPEPSRILPAITRIFPEPDSGTFATSATLMQHTRHLAALGKPYSTITSGATRKTTSGPTAVLDEGSSKLTMGVEQPPGQVPLLLWPLLQPEKYYPLFSPQLLNRLVALLLQVCHLHGPSAFASQLLPYLLPVFELPLRDRGWYGITAIVSGKHRRTPSGTCVEVDQDSGYWDLVHLLYPEAMDALGTAALRAHVADWRMLERNLVARYGWKPPQTAAPMVSIPVSSPNPSTTNGAGGQRQLGTIVLNESAYERDWHWYPADPLLAAAPAGSASWPAPPPQTSLGHFWESPWRLQCKVVHSWKAHSKTCSALLATEDESLLVTAGGARTGGPSTSLTGSLTGSSSTRNSGADVIRCWRLSDLEAEVQYSSHLGQVLSMCLLGAPRELHGSRGPLLASVDNYGELHLWSSVTGQQLHVWGSHHQPSSRSNSRTSDVGMGPGCRGSAPGHRNSVSSAGEGSNSGSARNLPDGKGWSIPLYSRSKTEPDSDRALGPLGPPLLFSPPGPQGQYMDAHLGGRSSRSSSVVDVDVRPSEDSATSTGSDLGLLSSNGVLGDVSLARHYSSCCAGGVRWERHVAAATLGSCLRLLDCETGAILTSISSAPTDSQQNGSWIRRMCCPPEGSWLAAGTTGGGACVADLRLSAQGAQGGIVARWQPHTAAVTCCQAQGEHTLLTTSKDGSLKVWDLRMVRTPPALPALGIPSPREPSPLSMPICTASLKSPKGAITGLAYHGTDVVAFLGSSLAVFSLSCLEGAKLAPLKLRGADGHRQHAKLVSVVLLPSSQLMVAAQDDGYVRICR